MKNSKSVFIAEYLNPRKSTGFSILPSSANEHVLIVADSYQEAANKAETYLETIKSNANESILDADGSLKNLENNDPQLVGIRISDSKIIW